MNFCTINVWSLHDQHVEYLIMQWKSGLLVIETQKYEDVLTANNALNQKHKLIP